MWKSTSVSKDAAVLAPPSGEEPASSRHRAGAASIQRERAVNLISTQVATLDDVARDPHRTSKGMPAN